MNDYFGQVWGIFLALLPIALIVGVSAGVAKRGYLPETASKGLSDGIVYLFLPCLIFDKVTAGLKPEEMPLWWAIPLVAVAFVVIGGILTALVFRGRLRASPDLFPLGFMQNAGYLVLAVGTRLLKPEEEQLFAAYTFLFVLGFSPLLWSIGKHFVSRDKAIPFAWKQLLTPPLFANILAVILASTGLQKWIPEPVTTSIHMLGNVAVPASLVVLGASLSMIRPSFREDGGSIVRVCVIKLLLVPAVVITLLHFSGLGVSNPLLAFMLVLQASSPQATNFIIFVRTYGGNLARTGTILLVGYALALLTIPIWLGVWNSL